MGCIDRELKKDGLASYELKSHEASMLGGCHRDTDREG